MSIPYLHAAETKLVLQVKKDLERHEGFREYAYPDPLSKIGRKYRGKDWPWGFVPAFELLKKIPGWTIADGAPWTYGFGDTHGVTPSSQISRQLAERKLEEHILNVNKQLANALYWYEKDTSFVTKTILVNMVFNMGLAGVLKFKNTLAFVKAYDYKQAAHNLTLSRWYSQVGSRAKELVKRMETQIIEPQHKAPECIK